MTKNDHLRSINESRLLNGSLKLNIQAAAQVSNCLDLEINGYFSSLHLVFFKQKKIYSLLLKSSLRYLIGHSSTIKSLLGENWEV